METNQHIQPKTTCTSFENSIISCHLYFIDENRYESRTVDSTWKAQTFTTRSLSKTVFESKFPIYNLAYEKLYSVGKSDNIKFAIKIASTVIDTIECSLFNSIILTSKVLSEFIEFILTDDNDNEEVYTLSSFCYSNNYDPHIRLPLTVTFRKLSRQRLMIESVSITVDNNISDMLFNRFAIMYNQHKFGPGK